MSDPTPDTNDSPADEGPSRRTVAIVLGAIAAVALIGLTILNQQREQSSDLPSVPVRQAASTVLYEVEGSATSVSITVETPTGTSQAKERAVPLTTEDSTVGNRGLSFQFKSGAFVYISAQNEGETGTVICRITVDGVVVSENTADGAYAIATCKGRT